MESLAVLSPFINPKIMSFLNEDITKRWFDLEFKLIEKFGRKPDLEAILFLIGIQEVQFVKNKFTKEEKQDLIHIAICIVMAPSGYYILEYYDDEGWPHFKQIKDLPKVNMNDQELFLKEHVLLYFSNQENFNTNNLSNLK